MRLLGFNVTEKEDGITVLDFLKSKGFSRRIITALKHSGAITVNGEILRSIDPVSAGSVVNIRLSDEGKEKSILPNPDIDAEPVYNDEDTVVFDKAPFVPVHPSIAHHSDTLANLFAHLYPDCIFRPINRLDKNTSGLCICAKNQLSAAILSEGIQKTYFAIVEGEIREPGVLDFPIGRADNSIIKREVRSDGQPAVTLYKPILWKNGRTLLEITMKTGRTHQIRVHFSHVGFPLCGDDMYGGNCSAINRHALHCGEISFTKPFDGRTIALTSELPEDMKRLIE